MSFEYMLVLIIGLGLTFLAVTACFQLGKLHIESRLDADKYKARLVLEASQARYGSPKEIQELKDELARQAEIVNRLDADGLEYVKKKSEEIAGRLHDIQVGQMLGRK